MRLCFAITRSDSVGGASIHVRDMSKALQALGHEVRVAIGGAGEVSRQIEASGVAVEHLSALKRSVNPLEDLRALWQAWRFLRRYRPELVSAHTSKAGLVFRLAGWLTGVPVLYTPHCWSFADGFPGAKVYRVLERAAAPFARRIICVSHQERDLALQHGVGRPETLVVVHNGMPDVARDLRADASLTPPRLVMIGRFEKQKDQPTLLRALASLRDRPWTLDLVGDGPLLGESKALARQLGMGDRVNFLGYKANVTPILAAAQIFTLITHWESFPRSILEAMRSRLPVVASDIGGIRESVRDGANGYIVAENDHEILAIRLAALLDSAPLRERMGAESRRMYEAHFTFDRMLRDYLELYARLRREKMPEGAPAKGELKEYKCG